MSTAYKYVYATSSVGYLCGFTKVTATPHMHIIVIDREISLYMFTYVIRSYSLKHKIILLTNLAVYYNFL